MAPMLVPFNLYANLSRTWMNAAVAVTIPESVPSSSDGPSSETGAVDVAPLYEHSNTQNDLGLC